MSEKNRDKEILETISEMIKKGESEESIIDTLKSLGIEEEKIKPMIAIARKEIYENITKQFNQLLDEKLSTIKDEIVNKSIEASKDFLSSLLEEMKIKFERELNEIEKTRDEIAKKVDVIESLVAELKLRVDKLEYKGGGFRSIERRILSVILIIVGILIIGFGIYSYFYIYSGDKIIEIIKGLAILISGGIVLLGGTYIK